MLSRLFRRLLQRKIEPFYQNLCVKSSSSPIEASGVPSFKENLPQRAVSAGAETARHGRFGQSQNQSPLGGGTSMFATFESKRVKVLYHVDFRRINSEC